MVVSFLSYFNDLKLFIPIAGLITFVKNVSMRFLTAFSFLFLLINFGISAQSSSWCDQNSPVSGLPDTVQSTQPIVLSASSGYESYLWSNGHSTSQIMALFTGEYYLTITGDSSCITVDTVVVSILNAYTNVPFTALCEPQNVSFPVSMTSGINTSSASFTTASSAMSGSSAYLPSGASARTFETWIYHTGQSSEVSLFTYGDVSSNQQFRVLLDENDSLRLHAGNFLLTCPQPIPQNDWHHISVMIDSTGIYSFTIDFQMLNYDSLPGILNCGGGTDFMIGKGSQNDLFSFQGSLDELKFWSAALSPFEIQTYAFFHANVFLADYHFFYFDFNEQVGGKYYSVDGLPLSISSVSISPSVPFSPYQYLINWQNYWVSDSTFLIHYIDQSQNLELILSDGLLETVVEFEYLLVETPNLMDHYFLCQADSVVIQTSAEYQDYLWSNGQTAGHATFTQSGNYTLNVTSYTCSFVDSFQVDLLSVTINQPDTSICLGESLLLSAQSTEGYYYWSTDQVTSSIVVTPSVSQWYSVLTANSVQTCIDSVFVEVHSPPQSILASTYSVCNQSSVILLAATDLSFDYIWSNGETGPGILAEQNGWYEVSITNSVGCNVIDSCEVFFHFIDIPQSDYLICDSQPITVSANASSALIWSDGSMNSSIQIMPGLPQAVYTVNLTDFPQCKDSVQILTGGNFNSGLPDSLFSCGLPTQLISASQLPVSYAWSNGSSSSAITVSESGLYSVWMTDSIGCTIHDSVLVSLIFSVIEQTADTVCEGELVMLSSWAGNYDYLWSTGETDPVIFVYPMESITYVLAINDDLQACYFTADVFVNQVPTGPILGEINIYAGDTIYLYTVNGADDSEFEWLVSGGIIDSIQGDSIWIIWSFPGEAYIQVTEFAANGCTGIPVELYLQVLGSGEVTENELRLFPNPVNELLQIYTNESFYRIKIYSMEGKCVLDEAWPSGSDEHHINLKSFSGGIYSVQLIGETTYLRKIIKY